MGLTCASSSELQIEDAPQLVRGKRQYYTLKKVVAYGREIMKAILKDAISTPAPKRFQPAYRKVGGLQKLNEDFYRFKPQIIQGFDLPDLVEGRTGVVADRILIAKNKGKGGRPTLTILKAKDIRQLEMERKHALTTKTIEDLPHVEITYLNTNF